MKRSFIYLFFIPFCISSGCTTIKNTSDSNPVILKDVKDASALFNLVEATDLPFTWFGAEGTGTIDWDGERYSAKMIVRIERNKIIWAQIQKLGFEIGRMLIRPDSAFFINRIERTYASYSTPQFFEKYNLPADFEMFSKVFTGGAYIPPMVAGSRVENDGSLYIESESGVNARHWLDITYKLVRSVVTDQLKHEWSPGYSDYRATNTGQEFPFKRSNTLVSNGGSNIFDLEYSSIVINVPQEFPFSVPSHYEKM